jgi:hypothetical protein
MLPPLQRSQQQQHFAAAAASLRQFLWFILAGCYRDASIDAFRACLQAAAQHNAKVEGSGLLTTRPKEQSLMFSLVDLREEEDLFPLQRTPLHKLVSNVRVSAGGNCPECYDLTAAAAVAEAFGATAAAQRPGPWQRVRQQRMGPRSEESSCQGL